MAERISRDEWIRRGTELFGDDMLHWEFVCPACGHVQKPEDFRPYKDRGATPDSARQECIGRYAGAKRKAFDGDKASDAPGPCDYAAFGLLPLSPLVIVHEGEEHQTFGFNTAAEPVESEVSDAGAC